MRLIFFFFLLAVGLEVFGQARQLRGKVIDAITKAPIGGAVMSTDFRDGVFVTNRDGYFEFGLEENETSLVISHLSFEKGRVVIPENDQFSVLLASGITDIGLIDIRETQTIESHLIQELKTNPTDAAIHAFPVDGWSKFFEGLQNEYISKFDTSEVLHAEIQLRIDKNGKLSHLEVNDLSGTNSGLKWLEEAIRTSLQWSPARQQGIASFENFRFLLTNEHEIFTIVEQQPFFKDGIGAFYEYVSKNIRYPREARSKGIEGKVFVKFVVDKDGSITNAEVVRGIGAGCDEEAVRVVSSSPAWNPGMHRGKPVKVRMVLPINFYTMNRQDLSIGFTNNVSAGAPKPEYYPATYPGGNFKFTKFIKKNLQSPDESLPINARNNSVQITFSVDSLGKLDDFKVERGLGPAFDREAMRVARLMPDWQAAVENGEPIKSRGYINIQFEGSSTNNKRRAGESFLKAIRSFENEDPFEAMQHFNKAIELEPENLQYYLSRAALMIELEQMEGACRDLKIIREGHPDAQLLFDKYCQVQH